MTITISLDINHFHNLDLTPAQTLIETWIQQGAISTYEQQLQFLVNYPLTDEDPREVPEIPEVRLWFIRLDATYPWLLFLLDWKSGELARYVAMLVPHEFSRREGIQYNPEALEIFVMHKVFTLMGWLKEQGLEGRSRLKAMAQVLGYDLEDDFFELVR